MIVAIPADEAGHAFVDRSGRLEAQIALDGADVGVGVADVPGLHREEPLLRLATAGLLDQLDHPAQLLGAVIAYIVEAVGRAAAAGFLLPLVPGRGVGAAHNPPKKVRA